MKKINYLFAALAIVAVVGCSKETEFPVEKQEISVHVKGIESGDFTRASGTSVTNLIESLFLSLGCKTSQ